MIHESLMIKIHRLQKTAMLIKREKMEPKVWKAGEVWRKRDDSHVLLPQDNTSSLPGLTLEGEPSGYPMKDEIAELSRTLCL
jgi:hypothetical protein